jgi:hypothetical protein
MINQKNQELLENSDPIVYPEPIICMSFTCFEGAFIHVISWLYLKYYDNKKSNENIKFLREKLNDYSGDKTALIHLKDVREIRTFLHHGLSSDNKKNLKLQLYVKKWFIGCCNNEFPQTEKEWHLSLKKVLDDALIFFTLLYDCVEIILHDEFKTIIVSEWKKYMFPFSVYDIEQIVDRNAKELGINNLNAHEYTLKKYLSWKTELQIYSEIDEIILNHFIEKTLRSAW